MFNPNFDFRMRFQSSYVLYAWEHMFYCSSSIMFNSLMNYVEKNMKNYSIRYNTKRHTKNDWMTLLNSFYYRILFMKGNASYKQSVIRVTLTWSTNRYFNLYFFNRKNMASNCPFRYGKKNYLFFGRISGSFRLLRQLTQLTRTR